MSGTSSTSSSSTSSSSTITTALASGTLTVPCPGWSTQRLVARIVHIGCGAFHRAHQALYCHQLLATSDSDWGICEVSLMSRNGAMLADNLKKQNLLYCVAEQSGEGSKLHIVGAIKQALHPHHDGCAAIIEALAAEHTAVVTMTITEKGYCTDAASGQLDLTNPLIVHDLAHPEEPHSAVGYLVQALHLRRQRNLGGFSVLSCDNLRENGHVARTAVLGLAQARDPQLATWIAQQVTFPCSMVDRIVPAVNESTLQQIASQLGAYDPCAIACEPFSQWVIEDNFIRGRPAWDQVGAQFVDNVVPFEMMKLRMLNGSHSFLAYLGYLAGYHTIAQTMEDNAFCRAVQHLMLQEQAATLTMPPGTDLTAYASLLIERFRNPALHHKTAQIASDGSQKLPQRLLDPIRQHLARGHDCRHLLLGVAGWMRYVQAIDEQGNPYSVTDPLAQQYQAVYQQHRTPEARVRALLAIHSIFADDLPANQHFVSAVTAMYQQLCQIGARAAVRALHQGN